MHLVHAYVPPARTEDVINETYLHIDNGWVVLVSKFITVLK